MLMLLLTACLKTPGTPQDFLDPTVRIDVEPSSPADLCDDPSLHQGDFCMPARLEGLLRDAPITFIDGEAVGEGVSGVMKMRAMLSPPWDESLVVDVKWKPGPKRLTGLNNAPRKEVATYEIQKYFMPPERIVVPPTVIRCMPMAPGRDVEKRAGGDDIPCVWGAVSQWVNAIEDPKDIDEERMKTDPAYRLAVADLNLLAAVVDHRDTRQGNWFVSTDPERVRAIVVDNGMTFSGIKNPALSLDWSQLFVPALPSDSIARLRQLTREDLAPLANLGTWQKRNGRMVRTAKKARVDKDGVHLTKDTIAHGLSENEIDHVYNRIQTILEKVDKGEIGTFDPAPVQPSVAAAEEPAEATTEPSDPASAD